MDYLDFLAGATVAPAPRDAGHAAEAAKGAARVVEASRSAGSVLKWAAAIGVGGASLGGGYLAWRWWSRRQALNAGTGSMDAALEHAARQLGRGLGEPGDIIREANLGIDRSGDYTVEVVLPPTPSPSLGAASDGGSDAGSTAGGGAPVGLRGGGQPTVVAQLQPYKDQDRRLVCRGIWSDVVAECKAQFGLLSHTPAHHQAVVAFMNRWLRETFPDLRKADIARNVPRCAMAYFIRTDAEVELDQVFDQMVQMGRVRRASEF